MHSFNVQPERIVDIAIKAESKEITGEFSFSLLCASLHFFKELVSQFELSCIFEFGLNYTVDKTQ